MTKRTIMLDVSESLRRLFVEQLLSACGGLDC